VCVLHCGKKEVFTWSVQVYKPHMCTGAYLTLSHNSFLGPFSAFRSCLWFVYDLRLGGIIFHKKREKEIQVRNRLLEQVYLLSAGCLSLLHCVCSGLSRSSPGFFPFFPGNTISERWVLPSWQPGCQPQLHPGCRLKPHSHIHKIPVPIAIPTPIPFPFRARSAHPPSNFPASL